MKTDFSKPQRQELRGIVVIYFMTLLKRLRQNIYAFLPLLSENIRENYWQWVVLGVLLFLILQLLYSYKSYLNFKFYIKNEHFYLKHGVFKISDVEIPFDRIQNININQNLIQQMLNVVGVEIETAGQGDAEINIKALSKDNAIQLKNHLLEQKTEDEVEENEAAQSKQTKPETIFKLDISRLLKVGLSSNYLKGLGLVIAFIVTLYQYIEDIFSNFIGEDFDENYLNQIPETLTFFAGFAIVILVLAFMVTVGSVVIKYFEMKVTKINKDFEVEYGLLKRINKVIKKDKTQVFEIVKNPIANLFKIKNLYVSQASSEELSTKNKIGLVGVTDKEIQILFQALFDQDYHQNFINKHSNFRLFLRLISRYLILVLGVGFGVSIGLGLVFGLSIGTFLLLLFGFISYKTYTKSSLDFNDNMLKINSGAIHTNYKYIALYKIQSMALSRNIFQQRNGYADLIIYTASGDERVSYLKYDEVLEVVNYLNYKVESSQLSWI